VADATQRIGELRPITWTEKGEPILYEGEGDRPVFLCYSVEKKGEKGIKLERSISCSRVGSAVELLFSPIWIPLRAITSVVASIFNLLTFGSLSVQSGTGQRGLKGRMKAMGRSALSLLFTPASMAVEGLSAVTHLVKPGVQKIDYVASYMWSGGALRSPCPKNNASRHLFDASNHVAK
jgi:hypothetical protein